MSAIVIDGNFLEVKARLKEKGFEVVGTKIINEWENAYLIKKIIGAGHKKRKKIIKIHGHN